jgi:putative transposase
MARQLRIEYEGAIYHVMSRGDRREAIFLNDEDRQLFLKTLEETCLKAGWLIHAYVLMGNHFHLVVETPQPTLVSGMKWFLGTYTQRFNACHRLRGHLFAGRYKSLLVDGSDDYYLRVVCDYVHLNPLRAGLLEEGAPLESYLWSSYPEYLKPPGSRWQPLQVERLLGEHGIQRDDVRGRSEFRSRMEERCRGEGNIEEESLWGSIRKGWKFGAADFLKRLGELSSSKAASSEVHLPHETRERMEEKARRLIREYLLEEGMAKEAFLALRKGDSRKVALARELRQQTTMRMAWIAKELNAGVPQTLWKALWALQQKGVNTRD